MRTIFVLIGILCMTIAASCSRENEDQQPQSGVSFEKNIFQEVKEQTIHNPKDPEAWYHLADQYENNHMYPEEIETLKKVIALDPGKGYAYIKLGNAYNRTAQYAEAVKCFSTAKKHFPKNPLVYNNLAVSYGMLGKHEEEIRNLEQAISLRPHYATARYNLGVVLLKQGKREAALKQYRALLEFDVNSAASLKKEIDASRK